MPRQIHPKAVSFPYLAMVVCKNPYNRSFKLPPEPEAAVLTAPVNSLLLKMRSIKGTSMLNENRLKTMDKMIKRLYQPI